MIKCNHFRLMSDFLDATECFQNVEIKGGVNYFLYDPSYTGKCLYKISSNGVTASYLDYLDASEAGVVIRDTKAISIVNKIASIEGLYYKDGSFAELVGPVHLFDKDGQLGTKWNGYKTTQDSEHNIKYYLNKKLESCGYGWITKADIPKGLDSLPLHKVYISEAYGAGDSFPHQIIGVPFYGEPNSVCSETYLCIGFKQTEKKFTEEECKNMVEYIKTKFFRFMVFVKKKTQHCPSSVFQFVPMQDFSKPWTDEELYNKYDLDLFEREYIDSLIKPME